MKKMTKGIIAFVFALMVLMPFSVFASTEITQADFDAAKGGTPTKGITYDEEVERYTLEDGEYLFGSDVEIAEDKIFIENGTVELDLNGKTLSNSAEFGSLVQIIGKSNVTITGNGTIDGPIYSEGSENNKVSLTIKNGTFKDNSTVAFTNLVIDDGTFDTTEANCDAFYIIDGSNATINGGTFKSTWNGVMVESFEEVKPGKIVINGGTFIGEDEAGLGAFGVESLEINGGTFTGGKFGGLYFADVDNIALAGGTYKATSEDGYGAITLVGEDTTIIANALAEGCSYDPALETEVTTSEFDVKYAHSQKEITVVNPNAKGETKTEAITVMEGENQTYTVGESEAAVFRFSADYSLFENGGKVYVDDALVDSSNYTSESGSTIIKLAKAYMATLANGEHTIKVVFNNGEAASAKFTVKGSTVKNPNTSDNTLLYVEMLGLSVMCLFVTSLYLKKEQM